MINPITGLFVAVVAINIIASVFLQESLRRRFNSAQKPNFDVASIRNIHVIPKNTTATSSQLINSDLNDDLYPSTLISALLTVDLSTRYREDKSAAIQSPFVQHPRRKHKPSILKLCNCAIQKLWGNLTAQDLLVKQIRNNNITDELIEEMYP